MNNFWFQRPVFITGCSGFLGSWLTQELLERGAEVIGLVRDWTPYSRLFQEGLYQQMTIVHGEMEDLATLERTLNEYEINTRSNAKRSKLKDFSISYLNEGIEAKGLRGLARELKVDKSTLLHHVRIRKGKD